ncbi:energy transducer TonB [Acinetobacter sp. ACNIH2]|uniref:energy transducer TonB n=1 Tax=Acinetobacter sp. ACNIH2 TaxID=1758189 RepID=UPI000CDBDAAC|nr:energy transducer TonB [Acinetobacter sp. ACNIH2]AUX87512.1 energy transducer TonB [Acinetobacter sp. ACNIH2]
MSEVSRSPYKKAILFEQLQNVQSNVFHAVDPYPFAANLANSISAEKPVQTNNIFWAIAAVLSLHYGIFYLAKHLPTPPLIVKKPEPIAVVIEKPKEEQPKVIEPKLKQEIQKPIIPPVSAKPQPVQKQVVEKSVQKPVVQKSIEQPRPTAKSVAQPAQQVGPTENVTPTQKVAEPVSKPTQENLPVTAAKGYAGYLSNPAPEYPEVALDRGWEGVVLLRVKVSPTGSPLEINLKNSSGKKVLDDAAVKTVKRWKFSPALRGNTPVEGWVDVPIHFKLPN